MPSSEHLPAELTDVLRRGRAIPMLVDYRPPEMPDYTLTVIGKIDDEKFLGVFLPDDYAGEELIRLNNPPYPESAVTEITTDSADAKAIHKLWSHWHGGVLESYLQVTRAIAMALTLDHLQAALETAEVVREAADTPAPKDAGKKSGPNSRKKKGARRVTKPGSKPRSRR